MSDRVAFTCNDTPVEVEVAPGESLLSVLRERLGLDSVKDGCAPQGQCGCCTVLVDGEARVACVTPAERVSGRSVTTVEGVAEPTRTALADAFVATGGSQCGFCTPGIAMRAASLLARGRTSRVDLDRALAAHLCRCTGWRTVYDAIDRAAAPGDVDTVGERDLDAAASRAALEGGVGQAVGPDVVLGHRPFADDVAPRDALVAVPRPPGSDAPAVAAAGHWWVLGETLFDARAAAGKVQGRRTSVADAPPLTPPPLPGDGVRLATSWVEPAYLEPDASWCEPEGEPFTPLANGGAFGGKTTSIAPLAARELAAATGRPVRVVFAREDVVRLGAKRPPIAASAAVFLNERVVKIKGMRAGTFGPVVLPYALDVQRSWREVALAGPPVGELRAPWAEEHVLVEGALDAVGADRSQLVHDARSASVLLDSCAREPGGALAGARVELDVRGALASVSVRVAAGDPLDDVVLRSYAIGAAHMALGWVLSESIAVDPQSGEVHDLTIRSFGIVRPRHMPAVDVSIVDDAGPPLPRASDAVFAAVAGATWNAVARAEGARPESFPARLSRAATAIRR
ncbi:MAG: aerobic-type carbon monoxide dehydrogenase, small subunit CoxS/CutS-like protein [Actinomycetia bacterium]|nr:aerobic-type carbon monoxide dehydrogenase, small subunit CoxS/CutS-like protein [Actinomycetes bacterium]